MWNCLARTAATTLALAIGFICPSITETAIANGDTRTISLIHAHTNETITATFKVGGSYDSSVLEKLNWFLRDWRRDEPTRMDPRLFDLVWETYRESGSQQPIKVMSAYRSPETNAMLRRRSRAVAEHSQHILGKAMDQHYLDVPMSRVREIGLRLARGGVGYYPTAGSPFVHLDVGSVRYWPRMSYDQLARVFPDGKTVLIPSNGQPLSGYELARAEIAASGSGEVPVSSIGRSKTFFQALFGGGEDDDGPAAAPQGRGRRQLAGVKRPIQVASLASDSSGNGGSTNFFLTEARNTSAPLMEQVQASNARLTRRGARIVPEKPATLPVAVPVAPVVQVAAAAPLPPVAEVAVAKVTVPVPVPEPRPQVPVDEPRNLVVASNTPLPPRRPASLAALALAANVPLPPARPAEIGAQTASQPKPDALAKLIVASNRDSAGTTQPPALPDVILHGPGDSAKSLPLPALGYAPSDDPALAPPRPVIMARPAAIVSAGMIRVAAVKPVLAAPKVDRASLRGLTGSDFSGRDQQQATLGAAAPALRAGGGMRAQAAALFADPMPGTAGRFDKLASGLPSDRFLPQ